MKKLTVRDIAEFAMLGALMFAGKKFIEFLPNVHPLTLLTVVYTVVYRRRAIYPLAVYLLLETAFSGFVWIVPYYYIFPLCYFVSLLVPRGASRVKRQVLYTLICTFFGIAFGALYAPWQAVMYGLNLERTLLWISAGLPYDIVHAVANCILSFLIIPIANGIEKIKSSARR